ncbi:alpha-1,2-fucosyltransferase [Flavobacteriaceae bacterium]|nr:alpha-1,2-fucosyltransferase [Flavobacteriaceae bacterium]
MAVVVKLFGGLGNQMFQYATGRGIADKTNQTLKIETETGFIDDFYERKYSLNHFNIIENIVSPLELPQHIIGVPEKNVFLKRCIQYVNNRYPLLNYRYPRDGWMILHEKNKMYDQRVMTPSEKKYLVGYWQSEKYFLHIRDILINDFSLKVPFHGINLEMVMKMSKTNSVSLHLRRLHGISNGIESSAHNETHGALILDYYQNALNYIKERVSDLNIFVFSDDQDWARSNINLPFPTYFMDQNDDNHNYLDLILMSKCKHQIIANSSFSWWGAWLNQNPSKIVISPRKWFVDDELNENDTIPLNWIKL